MCSERCRYFGIGTKMASQLLGYILSGRMKREDSSAELLRARQQYAWPGLSDTHGWGVKSPNRSLLICFEEVGLEQHCLSPCGGEKVQETQVPSSPWSAVAAG